MGLRLTFNLVLCIAVVTGISLASFFSYRYLQANARAEVLDSARIMMQSALAVRAYTVSEIRPLLELQQKRQFLAAIGACLLRQPLCRAIAAPVSRLQLS